MLKPSDRLQPAEPDKPVGELVHQLVEDGKAYARAELGVLTAIATAKGKALALPVGLLVAALFVASTGVTALAVGVVIALARFVGPLLAGVLGLLIFAGIGGALAWYGLKRLRAVL